MARPLVSDRIKETTDTTGTGTLDLAGAATGFRAFADAFTSSQSTYYLIVDDPDSTTQWELGQGTLTTGTPNRLSRDRVISSTNSGSKVSWSAGTKTVICPAVSEIYNSIIDTVDSDLVTAGTSTAYTITTNRPDVGLYEGRFVSAKLHTTSGSTPTLNVDGTGAKSILQPSGSSPASGAMVSGGYYWFKYSATATAWQVFSPIAVFGTSNIADGAITLAKMANLAANKLIGRATASTGVPEAVGLDSTLSMSGGNLLVTAASTSQSGASARATATQARAKSSTTTTLSPSNEADLDFESSEISITLGSTGTVAHSKGVKLSKVEAYLRCKTSEGGWSVGEDVLANFFVTSTPQSSGVIASSVDTTNTRYVVGNASIFLATVSTGAYLAITPANWRIVLKGRC